jgi:hypothetical protein
MRNAHGALDACHKPVTIGQMPTTGNSKTVARAGRYPAKPTYIALRE